MRKGWLIIGALFLFALLIGGCGQSGSNSGPSYDTGTASASITKVYINNNVGGEIFLTPGESIPVSAEATDDDDSGYLIKWEASGGTFSTTEGKSAIYTAPSKWGIYDLSVMAYENPDGSGGGGGSGFTVVVSPWKLIDTNTPSYDYYYAFSAIDSFDENNAWAVGWDSIYKYDGVNWVSQEASLTGHLDSISVVSTNDVWAFGWYFGASGIYSHYDGDRWEGGFITPVPNGTDFAAANDGWIVANGGVIRHWNGTTWESSPSSTTNNLNSVVAKADIFVWAIGDNGTILRYLGVLWENYSSPTTEKLNKIIFNQSNDGWIVGDNGTILHFDGTAWSKVASPTTANLNSIAFRNANDGWIIGQDDWTSVVLHYDGTKWETAFTATHFVADVEFTSENNGWMAGSRFLKYVP